MVDEFYKRRNLVLDMIKGIEGLKANVPKGAFYVFPDIRPTGLSSEEFAEKLLKETKVAVVPGNAFGEAGEGFVRCSYAVSVFDLTEAIKRIAGFVSKLLKNNIQKTPNT